MEHRSQIPSRTVRNHVNFSKVQPLTEYTYFATEPEDCSKHSYNVNQYDLKIDKKSNKNEYFDNTDLKSNGCFKGCEDNPVGYKRDEEIFGNSRIDKDKTGTEYGNNTNGGSNTFKLSNNQILNGDSTINSTRTANTKDAQFCNKNPTIVQNMNLPDTVTKNIRTIDPSNTEAMYGRFTTPTKIPYTSGPILDSTRNSCATKFDELPPQQWKNHFLEPAKDKLFYRNNSDPNEPSSIRDQLLGNGNPLDTNYRPNEMQRGNNSNRAEPTRDETFHINNVHPTMQTPTAYNNQFKYPMNTVPATPNHAEIQRTNNVNPNNPRGKSGFNGNNNYYRYDDPQRDECRQFDRTLRDYGEYSYNTDCGSNAMPSPQIMNEAFYRPENEQPQYSSTGPITMMPTFVVPATDVYYNCNTRNITGRRGTNGFNIDGEQSQTSAEYKVLSVLSDVSMYKRKKAEQKKMIRDRENKNGKVCVKCGCGKAKQFVFTVQDNDMRNCATCFNRVRKEFKTMFDAYQDQGFQTCKCKHKISVTELTHHYLKDQKLECSCEIGFKEVQRCT